jgi:3-(3-hydroxy-phenyl)propionate hydroxylase
MTSKTFASSGRIGRGQPGAGTVPPPGPGIVLPDLPITPSGRLRAVARDGFLTLTAPGTDPQPARAVAGAASCPVRVLGMADLDPVVRAGSQRHSARAGETWLIRPDACVAAITTGPADTLSIAMQRALG